MQKVKKYVTGGITKREYNKICRLANANGVDVDVQPASAFLWDSKLSIRNDLMVLRNSPTAADLEEKKPLIIEEVDFKEMQIIVGRGPAAFEGAKLARIIFSVLFLAIAAAIAILLNIGR